MNLYSQSREVIYSGDVILWKGDQLIAQAIRLFSGDFSHASLVLRIDQFQKLNDRRWVLEATTRGVWPNLLSNVMDQHGEAWLYPLKHEYQSQRGEIISWAVKKIGTRYDFGGVLKNIFGRVSANANRLFCSEYVYKAYKKAGIIAEQKAPRPGDIAKWDVFNKPIKIK